MWAGSPTSTRAACASSAIRPSASPRTICASCASSAFTRPMARVRPTRRALRPASRRARASRSSRASASAWRLLKLLRAAHATPTLAVMTETGLLEQVLGGVPLLASFENTCKVERAVGVEADPVRRLGALAVSVVEDAERLWQRLRLTNSEHARLTSIADGWSRVSPAHGEGGGARAALPARARPLRRPRAGGLGALVGGRRRRGMEKPGDAAGALERAEISAQGQGFHQARRRERPAARRRARRRRARRGSRPASRPTSAALAALADAAVG